MGAESGSQKVLDAMEKGIEVEQIFRATRLLRERGIRVSFFLQFGYPGEDWSDIEKTLAMVRRARPDDIGISVSYPLPGTKFHERVQEDLREKANWTDSDDLDMMFRGTYPPGFYRALYKLVHSDFRLRKEWSRFPRPGAIARSVKHLAGFVSARLAVEAGSRRRNPALP
jgi:anaerobic magnesium-protoporphyrin IX monomethyl ester cyclase